MQPWISETVARTEVLDYQQLRSCLRAYAKPRNRISGLLADGDPIRVRKGLYVFSERYRRFPVSREHLANLIYGPSYFSLDYALSHFGLSPERVETVTCVTTGEHRHFSTPFGDFTYRPLPPAAALDDGVDRGTAPTCVGVADE